jgi:hypothetical protein
MSKQDKIEISQLNAKKTDSYENFYSNFALKGMSLRIVPSSVPANT